MQASIRRHRLLPALALLLAAASWSPASPAAGHGTVVHRPPPPLTAEALAAQAAEVRATEAAFAHTMAARDFAAFSAFIAPDAVFVDEPTLRGAEAVRAGWKPLFDGPAAAFSWEPGTVEVLGSGGLAMSYGPVFNAKGDRISTFYSVWRRERDGKWRIVFDHGCQACKCATPPAPAADSKPAAAN